MKQIKGKRERQQPSIKLYEYELSGGWRVLAGRTDMDNDRLSLKVAKSNDWWFHVSGTDCEGVGTYDVYDDCAVVQPDWQAAPNYAMVPDPPAVDTFEIRIPFSKIGVSTGDTLGIAYRAEWVPYTYGHWPSGAIVEAPSSWGTAILRQ